VKFYNANNQGKWNVVSLWEKSSQMLGEKNNCALGRGMRELNSCVFKPRSSI